MQAQKRRTGIQKETRAKSNNSEKPDVSAAIVSRTKKKQQQVQIMCQMFMQQQ